MLSPQYSITSCNGSQLLKTSKIGFFNLSRHHNSTESIPCNCGWAAQTSDFYQEQCRGHTPETASWMVLDGPGWNFWRPKGAYWDSHFGKLWSIDILTIRERKVTF